MANNGVTAFSKGTLAFNHGDANLYTRDIGELTTWNGFDTIAYAGHVSSQSGDFHWNVQKQTWGGGSWYYAMTQDLGLCHDWDSRTSLGSSLAGGCWIRVGIVSPTIDFCTELGYFGADPSNIPTSTYWNGDGTVHECGPEW